MSTEPSTIKKNANTGSRILHFGPSHSATVSLFMNTFVLLNGVAVKTKGWRKR